MRGRGLARRRWRPGLRPTRRWRRRSWRHRPIAPRLDGLSVNTGVQCALQATKKVYDCGGAMRPEFDPSARPSRQSRHLLPTTDRNDRLAATLDNFGTKAFV